MTAEQEARWYVGLIDAGNSPEKAEEIIAFLKELAALAA